MTELQHYATLRAYCEAIGIPAPKSEGYDVRSFAENMKTVRQSMPPFKHEFYALALKVEGGGTVTTGNHTTADLEATVFFNSPYQILHWDIAPDWEGYYVIFSENFLRGTANQQRLTQRFPFLLNDNTYPLPLAQEEIAPLLRVFENLYEEHQQTAAHQDDIIRHYIQILLLQTARLFYKYAPKDYSSTTQRDNDLNTVSRFRALIETALYPNQKHGAESPHQVQYYAQQLNIHPNHLNALTQRIAGHSASDLIQQHLLALATAKLKSTQLSVKEIAYDLYFHYPNHFSTFFKKQTGQSPNAFRKA
ncbi:MAG: helix-turn-helix domain-containing protein [Bacteroidota bacterium]